MVRLIEDALSTNLGVAEIVVDGQKVRYDRAQLLTELAYWRRKAQAEAGTRPLTKGFDISSAW